MNKYIIAYCLTSFLMEDNAAISCNKNQEAPFTALEQIIETSDAKSLITPRLRLITNLPYSALC